MIMLINQYPAFCIYSSTYKTNLKNNKQETIEMIDLQPVNKLIVKIKTTKPEPSPRPYTGLWGNQIGMSDLYGSHRKFSFKTE